MTTVAETFDPIPSWRVTPQVAVTDTFEENRLVAVPEGTNATREDLAALGFTGEVGQAVLLAGTPARLLYGIGDPSTLDANRMRDAAAAVSRALPGQDELTLVLPDGADAQAAVEGALLARYEFTGLRERPERTRLTRLTLVAPPEAEAKARRGLSYARATATARDLANSPPSMLTAAVFAETAERLAKECGLSVEVFDEHALRDLGCGGLLGVNAGSVDPPRMIKIRYSPGPDAKRLTLVGKGIMYDSGGIALKPADAVHATMKNDMSGAAAILAAMTVLRELGCPTTVTGYLMCTDNMPSGSATKLGDVLTIRGGTTVEVVNTDAEGRLVMADALVLAVEEGTDAIVDIATLTGACLRALGAQIAGVFGNDQPLVDRVLTSAAAVDEPAWQLPLATRYRSEMNSDVADMKNMGGPNAAAIHAALFLAEFVGDTPWAHIDIAGTAQSTPPMSWRPEGCTGFGARLLVDLATRPGDPG
jgi:leucyl aminopeptidase